jgi:hypothetical protein
MNALNNHIAGETPQPQSQADVEHRELFMLKVEELLMLARTVNISVLVAIDTPNNALDKQRDPYLLSNITPESSDKILATIIGMATRCHPSILTMQREDGPC